MDQQCIGVFVDVTTGRQRHQFTGALPFRKFTGIPTRRVTAFVRHDPDLEDTGDLIFQIEFRMRDAGTGTHHLHIARLSTTLVAKVVLVGDRPFTNKGDDLHILMRMEREPGAGLDGVIIPNPQRAHAHALRIMIIGEAEVMLCVQPTVVFTTKARKRNRLRLHHISPFLHRAAL